MLIIKISKLQNILVILCLVSLGFAQQTNTSNKKSSGTANINQTSSDRTPNLKQQALDAIYQEIDRAKSYNDLRDRITVWTLAADAIWSEDPQKAGKLLRDAYSLTKDAIAVKSENDSKIAIALKNDRLQRKLKTEILLVAQKHDIKLVKQLLDSFEAEDVEQLEKIRNSPTLLGSSSFAKRQLAAFAANLAKTDPQKAVGYAIGSLGFGVPQEFSEIYKSLLVSNPFYARQLFSEATTQFLSDNSLNLYDALILSSYLNFTQISEPDKEIAQRLLAGAFARQQRVWQAIQEQRLTDPNLPDVVLATSQSLYRLFQAHYPERLGEVESFIRQVSLTLSKPSNFADEKISESKNFNDAEALLDQAEKEKTEENRNALYLEAALAFARKKEFTRALDAAFHATDEIKREAVENYVRRLQSENLVEKNEFYEAIKVMDKINEPELRAETTVLFAKKAQQKKENQLAAQVLVDTQKILEKSFSSVPNARAYLWLGSAYASFNPILGLDLMYSAIKRTNQTKDFIELSSSPKIIHLGGKSNQAVIIGDSKGDFREGFKTLAKQYFNQTLLLAENFENKFLRGIAVIASASAVIEEENKKEKTAKQKSPIKK
jgi:hypothetical protein